MLLNPVITKKVRVDGLHGISNIDPRLVPGEEVEVVVRNALATNTDIPGLRELAATLRIDAPTDYSVNFEQVFQQQGPCQPKASTGWA